MPPQLTLARQIMLGFTQQEATYNAQPGSDMGYVRLHEYAESVVAAWDDTLAANTDEVHQAERATRQTLPRQSMGISIQTPRVTPQLLAGLLGLTLGTVATVQDGSLASYRHAITPVLSPDDLPSIPGQVRHDSGAQHRYGGIKGHELTLRNAGAFFSIEAGLIGAGSRTASAAPFPAASADPWLLWGYSRVWLKTITALPLVLTLPPTQGVTSLGVGALDVSALTYNLMIHWNNNLVKDDGYRPSSGHTRGKLAPSQRRGQAVLQLQMDTVREAALLAQYLLQQPVALELQVVHPDVIAEGGVFQYGFTLIIPHLQWVDVPRSTTHRTEDITLVGNLMDDGGHALLGFVYDDHPGYLVEAFPDVVQYTVDWEYNPLGGLIDLYTADWEYMPTGGLVDLYTADWE